MSTLKYRGSNNDYQGFYVKVTDTLPVGAVSLWGGITAPSGYLICDGRAVSRTEYADLFKAIGTNFGSGDGLTTFNIPDYRGRVPVGLDGSDVDFDTIGKTGGSKEIQEHYHNYTRAPLYGAEWSGAQDVLAQNTSTGPAITATTNPAGTGNSGNLQPYTVTNYIIKASNKVALERGNVVDSLTGEDTDSAPSVRAVKEALVEKYAINEVKTNKVWVDDNNIEHPIYRLEIRNVTLTTGTGRPIYYDINNKDKTFAVGGMMTNGVQQIPIPSYFGPNTYISLLDQTNTNSLNYDMAGFTNATATVYVEYTKTTD